FKDLTGDDQAYCRELRKRNRDERKNPTLPLLKVALPADLAAAIAALTPDQRLRAAQIPVVSLFKGQVKNLGSGKYEWSYDFSRPDHGADWRSDTPSVWGIGSGQLIRNKGEGRPFWFRGKLRGEFSVAWKALVKEGSRCNLVVCYGEGTNALQVASGLGLDANVWCGIGRYATNATLEALAVAGGSLSAKQSSLNFLCWQIGDLLKLQMRQLRQELVPARTEARTVRPDAVVIGFDSDEATQFEMDDVRITGVLDADWIKNEQLRVVAQQPLGK
ncbi:MAG: hypothetical protein N2689_14885, partial [Verrucomicrobiae bacterium]|nr:hypothetical protein [Verrucomicrobiae bacterium]